MIIDTDGNGISDAEEDSDGEKLTNIEEYRLGTSIFTGDTDSDMIPDYDEVYIYNTNPLTKDTDGDGADDKWEIDNNFDPLVYNESFEINDTVQGDGVCVEVNVIADGNSASSFEVNVHENGPNDINSTIPGYLGNGVDFSIEGEFESANIKYYFNEENIDEEGFNPVVYYYNEELNEMEEIDTVWNGVSNYVTAILPHFSTYLLLNKTKFDEVWNTQIKNVTSDDNGNLNINVAFVVDLSGSMMGKKLSTTKTAIKSFVNILEDNDCAGLISFTDVPIVHNEMTNDKDSLYAKINNMMAYGLTSIYTGLDKGVQMLTDSNRTGYKMIIIFTDGYDEPATTYDKYYKEIIDRAIDNNICVYTIGIGTIDENLLTKIAKNTGGSYYYASMSSELQNKIDEIKDEAKNLTKDSNNDGISDYHTKLICEGELRYSNGAAVQGFIGNYEKVQQKADYDDDGLVNGDEITIGTTSGGRPCVKMMSNPIFSDTDAGGYTDLEEKRNGTNAFCPDISKSDVKDLLSDDIYLASLFTKEYNDNWRLRAQLQAGNLITNFKYSYVADYRKALLTYLQQYVEAAYMEKMADNVKEMELSAINDDIEKMTNYVMAFSDVSNKSMKCAEYTDAVARAIQSYNELIDLRKAVAGIEKSASIAGYDEKLVNEFVKLQKQIIEQKSLLNKAKTVMNVDSELKLNGESTIAFGRFLNKLPTPVTKCLKVLSNEKLSNTLTYGTIAIDTGKSIYDTVALYSSMDVSLLQYAEIYEVIESIIENTKIDELRDAAKAVRDMLKGDIDILGIEFD